MGEFPPGQDFYLYRQTSFDLPPIAKPLQYTGDQPALSYFQCRPAKLVILPISALTGQTPAYIFHSFCCSLFLFKSLLSKKQKHHKSFNLISQKHSKVSYLNCSRRKSPWWRQVSGCFPPTSPNYQLVTLPCYQVSMTNSSLCWGIFLHTWQWFVFH